MPADPTTKAAILERSRESAARLEAAFTSLSEEQLLRPNTVGQWSLKDVLAHIAWEWLAGQLEAYLEGREPTAMECFGHEHAPGPDDDMSTNDGRNAWAYSLDKDLSLSDVLERYWRYRRRIDAVIERLPEEDFERSFAIVALGYVSHVRPAREGETGSPLWLWLKGNTWEHYEDHIEDFEAVRRG